MSHDVTLALPQIGVGRADVEFKIRQNGNVLGTLKASKGSLVWVPRDATYGFKLDWATFDTLMRGNGRHQKRS